MGVRVLGNILTISVEAVAVLSRAKIDVWVLSDEARSKFNQLAGDRNPASRGVQTELFKHCESKKDVEDLLLWLHERSVPTRFVILKIKQDYRRLALKLCRLDIAARKAGQTR